MQGKTAIIYCRVSSDDQVRNTSLEQQMLTISEFCERNNIVVDRVFHENFSAKTFDRPEWRNMIKYVKSLKNDTVQYLLFKDYSRFSRNTGEGFQVHELFLKKYNIEPQSITQWIDYRIPEYVLLLSSYLCIPQIDNVWRSIKTKDGMIARLRQGRFVCGSLPAGYFRKKGELLIVQSDLAPYIKEAFSMVNTGSTLYQVADRLKSMGYPKKVKYWKQALSNPIYKGMIVNKLLSEPVPATNIDPIVNSKIFDRVIDIVSGKQEYMTKSSEKYVLKGFCKCGECGGTLSGYSVKKKQKKSGGYTIKKTPVQYYICNNSGCRKNFSLKKMHEDFRALLESYTIDIRLKKVYVHYIMKTIKSQQQNFKKNNAPILRNIEKIKKRLVNLNLSFIDRHITPQEYQEMKAMLISEKSKAEEFLLPFKKSSNPTKMLDKVMAIMCDIAEIWSESDHINKIKLQNLLFPDGICYFKEKREYRTPSVNIIMELISVNMGLKRTIVDSSNVGKIDYLPNGSPSLQKIEPLLSDYLNFYKKMNNG